MVRKRDISTTGVPLFWETKKGIKYNVLFLERIHFIKFSRTLGKENEISSERLVRNWRD